jgi:predicted nucleic acid-binding protein
MAAAPDRFFDTNVFVYLLSADGEKASRAEDLIRQRGVISVQVLNEIVSAGLRKLAPSMRQIRDVLAVARAACEVKILDLPTHELALDLAERYRLAFYDALIVAAASLAGCSVLYTEDLQHGQRFDGVAVRNPFRPAGQAIGE